MKAKTNRRKQIIADHLGKAVHAVVDRPIGYRHGDIVYPVNYGYIPGLFTDDGEKSRMYTFWVLQSRSAPLTAG